jgi:hypothetical protein
MDGYMRGNRCFRSRISPCKFIDFRSLFLKGLFIRGLGLVILNSVYMACGDLGIVIDLWDSRTGWMSMEGQSDFTITMLGYLFELNI